MRWRLFTTGAAPNYPTEPIATAASRKIAEEIAEDQSRRRGNVVTVADFGDHEEPEVVSQFRHGQRMEVARS